MNTTKKAKREALYYSIRFQVTPNYGFEIWQSPTLKEAEEVVKALIGHRFYADPNQIATSLQFKIDRV